MTTYDAINLISQMLRRGQKFISVDTIFCFGFSPLWGNIRPKWRWQLNRIKSEFRVKCLITEAPTLTKNQREFFKNKKKKTIKMPSNNNGIFAQKINVNFLNILGTPFYAPNKTSKHLNNHHYYYELKRTNLGVNHITNVFIV